MDNTIKPPPVVIPSSSVIKSNNAWALGSYNEIAVHLLPVSAHLVR